jgi:hypothetical protein
MTIYAVNGKEPVAAWIPSLDEAGNGTTTLTDLVGVNNGTLTNMDAATDWVADTDAGGVRAIEMAGGTERIETPSSSTLNFNTGDFTICGWIRTSQTTAGIWLGHDVSGARQWNCWGNLAESSATTTGYTTFFNNSGAPFAFGTEAASLSTSNTWTHIIHIRRGTAGETWVNGSLIRSKSITVVNYNIAGKIFIGAREYSGFANPLAMGFDDIRIWDQALDSSDIAYLYNSGNGRGRVVEPAPTGVTYHPLSSRSTHPLRFSV